MCWIVPLLTVEHFQQSGAQIQKEGLPSEPGQRGPEYQSRLTNGRLH